MSGEKLQEKLPERFAVLATDVVLFSIRDEVLNVLLIPINRPPYFTNAFGFPGGLILPDQTAEGSAASQLKDKVGINPEKIYFDQLRTFSEPDRDPRNRVVSVAFLGLVHNIVLSDPEKALWKPYSKLPPLAYDHGEMKGVALKKLRDLVVSTNAIKFLLPYSFTLTELQQAYEIVLGSELDKRNFRKKVKALDFVTETGKLQKNAAHRPAKLYKFSSRKIASIELL